MRKKTVLMRVDEDFRAFITSEAKKNKMPVVPFTKKLVVKNLFDDLIKDDKQKKKEFKIIFP